MENEKTETVILDIGKQVDQTKQHIEEEVETRDSSSTQPHNGKNIINFVMSEVSEDELFAVTYSKKDKSVVGWLINVKNDVKLQQLGTCPNLDLPPKTKFVLHEKDLLLYNDDPKYPKYANLISFESCDGFAPRIRDVEIKFDFIGRFSMGFLPNGDLILASLVVRLMDYMIFLYSRANLSSPQLLYKIKLHSSNKQNRHEIDDVKYYIHQTKLFIFNDGCLTQWDLSSSLLKTPEKEMHYDLTCGSLRNNKGIVINKNQTLLASCVFLHDEEGVGEFTIDIYSMETGKQISRYVSKHYFPIKFITLKDNSERLILSKNNSNSDGKFLQKILDPFDTKSYIDAIGNPYHYNISTESNKQLYFDAKCHIHRKDWLKKDEFEQLLNKTTTIYYGNIYTSTIFETIRKMFGRIIKIDEFPENYEIKPGKLFRFNLKKVENSIQNEIKVEGFTKDNNDWKKTQNNCISTGILVLYEQVNDQALILITTCGIYIFTIVENSLRLRYFWNNESIVYYYRRFSVTNNIDEYKKIINEILKSESFKDSLPPPYFKFFKNYTEYRYLIEGIISDPKDSLEFASELFKIEIEREIEKGGVKLIFDIIIKLIEMANSQQLPVIGQYMNIINSKLPELCDNRYSSLVMKYILRTSILLDPSCVSIKNSKNTSLYAYSKEPYIKRTNTFKVLLSIFSTIYKFLSQTPKEDLVPTISFIVPFPGIWKYQKYQKDQKDQNYWNEIIYKPKSHWNKFIYKQKSILFCNIDSNNFYQWWNFAAIIDFKWRTFGRIYYFLIWIFYTIFLICFMLASTLSLSDSRILYILSILLGFIHLSFEVRQFLWERTRYIRDLWNLFEIGAYSLPIIASIIWLIDESPSLQITSIAILLLIFKFLLFFRVFPSYGKYFAIIIGVAKDVFPFLVVLFFILLGFGLAFFILLKPTKDFSLDQPTLNNDKNNPWNLVTRYSSINSDGSISSDSTLLQIPDSNTNMFSWFPTSLLAMYLFLTGDSGSLSPWTYREDPMIAFLIFVFSFFTVIYLMNLFIGLLNMSIEDYNKYEEFLLSKAQILMEIELYYMLPFQRYKKEWFPDWIYYDISLDKIRDLISAIDNKSTVFTSFPFISKRLRKLINVPKPIKQTEEELKKLKQQMNNIQNLLNIPEPIKQIEEELKELKQQMNNIQNLLNNLEKQNLKQIMKLI